jgi:hypothetical protein
MTSAITSFTYVHSTPGRMRIRVPGRRGDEQFSRWMEQELGAAEGITRVSANPLTGSVLILFDPTSTDDRRILAELGRMGLQSDLISSAEVREEPEPSLAEISGRVGTIVGKELVKAALSRAVGGSPVGLLLLFL